jgi:hypothetical protein
VLSDEEIAEAVRVAERLVRGAGCEPVVVGNPAAARSFRRGSPALAAEARA